MHRRTGRKHRGGRIVLAIALIISATAIWRASFAAFVATTANPSDSWASGTLALTATDGSGGNITGSAVFAATGWRPGDSLTKCITVTYGGTITAGAAVHLYAANISNTAAHNGHSLSSYLSLTVKEGTGSTDTSCTGFTPTSTLFDSSHQSGPSITGTVIAGSMMDFTTNKTNYASGLVAGWTPSTGSTSKSYSFAVSFPGSATFPGGGSNTIDTDLMAMTATTDFTWEVRS
jgi:hypothetical protein